MKKVFKRFIMSALSLILCFGVFAGCGKSTGTPNPGPGPGPEEPPPVHEGSYILKKGEKKSDYVIIHPSNATTREITAVNELMTFFESATGIVLDCTSDESVSYSETAKYLSVGKTKLIAEAEIEDEFGIGTLLRTGVRLLTKGETVFISGADDYGTLYSVYEFLTRLFNFEVFSEGIIRINKGVDEVPLYDFDITDVPDFQFNVASHYYLRLDAELRNRFRMIELQEQTVSSETNGNIYHNATANWLPVNSYIGIHPKWFSTKNADYKNLCYNAQGDAEELELLKQKVTELIIERVKAEPTKEYIAFNHMDTQGTICECDACTKDINKYGGKITNSKGITYAAGTTASVIRFLNDVRARLQEWFDTEGGEYDNNQKILFFAYHGTLYPPVKTVDGKVVPFEDEMVCKGIVPWFAETNGDYTVSLTDTSVSTYEFNGVIEKSMREWSVLSDEILFWTYGTNFNNYLAAYPSFSAFQETYRFASSQGIKALYAQHQTNTNMSTAWERMKAYLNYKLGWNVNADVNKLIDEFIENYFGPAADIFGEMFNEYRVLGEEQKRNGYVSYRSEFHNAIQAKYWPRNLLVKWLDGIDEAIERIQPLKKTDPALHDAYYFNYVLERISPAYLMVQCYGSTLGSQDLLKLKKQTKADAEHTGVNRAGEQVLISTVWSSWGIV